MLINQFATFLSNKSVWYLFSVIDDSSVRFFGEYHLLRIICLYKGWTKNMMRATKKGRQFFFLFCNPVVSLKWWSPNEKGNTECNYNIYVATLVFCNPPFSRIICHMTVALLWEYPVHVTHIRWGPTNPKGGKSGLFLLEWNHEKERLHIRPHWSS